MEQLIDYRGKTPKKTESGIPLITAKVIKNGKILPPTEFIAENDYESWMRRGIPKEGDVILTVEAPLGEVAQLDSRKIALAQRVITLRGKKDLLNNTFLKYLMMSNEFQSALNCRASGTTVLGIKQSELRKIQLTFPHVSIQNKIEKILSALDNKIELNKKINQTLESIAQAIFKSWFVDFDPVKAKIDGKKPFGIDDETAVLFPGSFEESEFGMIPSGWSLLPLSDVSDFQEGPGIMAIDFHETGVPLIRLSGLKNGVSLLNGCNYLDPSKVDSKWGHFCLKEGDILLSTSASLGRVAEVDSLAAGAIAYTGIIRFRALERQCTQRFLKHFLISDTFQQQVDAFGGGSVLKHFGPTHLKGMRILIPSIEIQNAFSKLIESSDRLIRIGINESFTLSQIRDVLLPKLISGEIDVNCLNMGPEND
ncbi:restriction endonuclease subunit S [Legionella resiliens]|uniref:Restriction endonuclease subunit S n=1 Tax=Legionella resiliens TaxID=2905958 RepID=A0ABS8X178_9GAMM|nr:MULTISPECIES: restriction endonuclease subunit S [unclassified Legionella]MCE0721896.1 restriction endonuclease subunit S [Legionella sp. 9fVS26]MCE3531050.1 restriction endonuclease subunit S [Legionella sp. 8cVS16]